MNKPAMMKPTMMKVGRQSQKGLSLMELMVAVTLGLFVVAAMIGLFVNSKENYRINENMARLQENGRFAINFLSTDFRLTDYRGCLLDDRLNNAIAGTNDAGLNGSDTVTIIYQSNLCGFGSTTVTTVYSIQAGVTGQPALFRSIDGGAAQELIEGIQDMQILYGEDTDGDFIPNYYVNSASVANMAQAVSVRFSLIARTLEGGITESGGRITRNFTSTITLRNRVP